MDTPLSPVVGPTALDVPKPHAGLRAQAKQHFLRRLEMIDQHLSVKLHKSSFGAGDLLVLVPAFLFSAYAIPVLLIFFLFVLPIGVWVELIVACLLTLATVLTTKRAVGRIRPGPQTLARKWFNLRSLEKNNAMPSGDSAQAAVFCCLLAVHFGEPRLLWMVPATMFGRVYFGCHWIGDTFAGVGIGALVAAGTHQAVASCCSHLGLHVQKKWLAEVVQQ